MAALTTNDKTELRSSSKFSKEQRAYVYTDFTETVIWRGTISDASPTRGQQSFTVSGSFETGFTNTDVHRHCRVHIGTVQDYDDATRRVVLSFNGTTTLVVDQSSDWVPANAQTVTIYNQYPLWNKLAYAVYDESAGTAVFYQDGKPSGEGGAGITYNEIAQLRPHIRIGRDLIRRTGTFPFTVDIIPSITITNPDASSGTTTVTVSPPGLATVSAPVPGTARLSFAAAGKGTVHVKHTDSLGGTTTAHRHIIIEDEDTPISSVITEFDYRRIAEQVGQGNKTAQVRITAPDKVFGTTNGQIDWGVLRSDALVFVTQTDYFDGSESTITSLKESLLTETNNILLHGYSTSARETMIASPSAVSSVTLNVETLPSQFTYALSVTGKTSPANFLEARPALMSVAGQIFITLDGYSTLCTVQDVELPWSDTALRAGNELVNRGDIMQGVVNLARARLMDFTVHVDGRIAVLPDLNMETTATRNAATTTVTLLNGDLTTERSIDVTHRNTVARVTIRGGVSNGELGSTSQFTPYLVTSTETPSSNSGTVQPDIPRQMFDDEADALHRVSRFAEISNQRVQRVTVQFDERYHHAFHIATGEVINLGLIYDATNKANARGENDLRNLDAIIESISYAEGTITVVMIPEAPVVGLPGVTLPQQELPTQTALDHNTPTFPDPFAYTPPIVASETGILIVSDPTSGAYATTDSGGTWSAKN